MIGPRQVREPKLITAFDIEHRIPADLLLRKIRDTVDFSFVRQEVAHCYGSRGNQSVDPIVVLKLMLLKFLENKSQRELFRQLPMRLDWLWFCEFDIDSQLPDHSVLTKNRKLWGLGVFERLFAQVLEQCMQAGLVDGSRIHVDSSVNHANASKDSIQVVLRAVAADACNKLDAELADEQNTGPGQDPGGADAAAPTPPAAAADAAAAPPSPAVPPQPPVAPGAKFSTTDPEARLTRKHGETYLGFKDSRAIDDKHGIVTATITTPANVDDASLLSDVVDRHEENTQVKPRTVIADAGYGTADVYEQMENRGITACIPHKQAREDPRMFPRSLFVYNAAADCFTCPAGKTMRRVGKGSRYSAGRATCRQCLLQSQCTASTTKGRWIRRHPKQDVIDRADGNYSREHRRRLLGRRRAIAEGNFADAALNHGYKRHRWRGLEGATIQNTLIATLQNLRKLLKVKRRPAPPHASCTQVHCARPHEGICAAAHTPIGRRYAHPGPFWRVPAKTSLAPPHHRPPTTSK